MKVLCIIGKSQQGYVRHIMMKMVDEMKNFGIETIISDETDENGAVEQRQWKISQRYDVVFTINAFMWDDKGRYTQLIDHNRPLYCTYLLGHPAQYLLSKHDIYTASLVLTTDQSYLKYIDKYMPDVYAAFLPMAGDDTENYVLYNERIYDIAYIGDYESPDKWQKKFETYSPADKEILNTVAKRMLECPGDIFEETVQQILKEHNISTTVEQFEKITEKFQVAYSYVYNEYQKLVLHSIVDQEIPIHVFGAGWNDFEISEEKKKNLIIHPVSEFKEISNILGNTKVFLNIMNRLEGISYGGVLSAMLSGALCLTTQNHWMPDQFQEGQNLYFYSLKGLKFLPAKIKDILSDLHHSEEVALNGRKLAINRHRWYHRIAELADYWDQTIMLQEEKNNLEEYYEEMVTPNLALLQKTKKIIRYFHRQEYLYAVRQMNEFLESVEKLFIRCCKWEEILKKKIEIFDINELTTMVQNLCHAQELEDYIKIEYCLQTEWIPFVMSLQEIYTKELNGKVTRYEDYVIEYSTCGAYTISIYENNNKICMHSPYDPYSEAMELAESWFDNRYYDYIVFGLGLGYHIKALLDIDEAISVTVIEPDQNLIRLAHQYGALGMEAYGNRLQIVCSGDLNIIYSLLQENHAQLRVFSPSVRSIKEDGLRKKMEGYFIDYSSMSTQITRLKGNFIRNRELITHEVTELMPKFRGKTVYIIAAGPSLDRNIHYLRKVDDGIILATGTVLKKMCAAGIKPDYVIITDGGAFTYQQTEDFDEKDIPLLYLPTVYHKILKNYPGEKYVICQKDFSESEKYAKEHGYPLYQTGGSVTTTALDVAIRLQCNRVVFVGLDLAYSGEKNHAEGTADVKINQMGNCRVKDIYGNFVSSSKNLNIYRQWIEKRIREKDAGKIEFIDATEGGALIEGTEIKKLKKVCGDAMHKVKISVIIPCYNVEKYVDRCIQSLILQQMELRDMELIFIDDASTDSTWEKLKVWESRYPDSIILIHCEKNGKQGTARNIGMEYASGEYIGFVDCDDYIESDMYRKLYDIAQLYDCDVVSGLYVREWEDGKIAIEAKYHKNGGCLREINSIQDRRILMHDNLPGGIWSGIYRKKMLTDNDLKFPEQITYEDNYWSAFVIQKIKKYYIVNEMFYHYVQNDNSTIMMKNGIHHFDRMKIELMKIEEYKRRNMFEVFYEEIEYDFICRFFLNSLHIFFTRFSEIPYDEINFLQRKLVEVFPNYLENIYLDELSPLPKSLLELNKYIWSKENIDEIAEQYLATC